MLGTGRAWRGIKESPRRRVVVDDIVGDRMRRRPNGYKEYKGTGLSIRFF